MSRTTHSVMAAVAIFLAATGLARAEAAAARTMRVRCTIAVPSGVTEPMTMMAQVYRVGRDNLGNYKLQGKTQGLIVSLMPGLGGTGSASFDTELEVGKEFEYELRVVPLDKEGNERTDGRYCFVSPEATGELNYDNTIQLRPGEPNEVIVNLRWIPKKNEIKSNFLQVVQGAGRAEYLLSLSVNDPTPSDVVK